MTIRVTRTVRTTAAPPERVLAYMLDFENAVEWDAGTVSCARVSGDGGVGTRYSNVSEFAGRRVEMEYTVESVEKDRFVVVGRSGGVESHDTVTVLPWGEGGTELEYDERLTLSGPVRFVAGLLKPAFNRLADRTAADLQTALDGLQGAAA